MARVLRGFLAVRLRLFRLLAKVTFRFPVVEFAYGRFFPEQTFLAARECADLYIGHNPQSLPVVAWAARLNRSRYAFDAEDLHSGEYLEASAGKLIHRLLRHLEARYFVNCCYLTASSRGIGMELARRYGIAMPATIYNVFPWVDRQTIDGKTKDRRTRDGRVSFYWYSQTVSMDRGLQDVMAAIAMLSDRCELHVRGRCDAKTRRDLLAYAGTGEAETRVVFHDPVPPGELLSRAAEHDVGLCLEQPYTTNRDLCATNKMFLYFLAGLAVIATDTRGQREVFSDQEDAGFLYRPGDVSALTEIMGRLIGDAELLRRKKAAALTAARTRWNWESEQIKLVETVRAALSKAVVG